MICHLAKALVSTPLPISFVSGAVTGLGGITTKRRTSHRSTRKVGLSIHPVLLSTEVPSEGKYLLERERLVKDNAWKLDT
jgi:hypothetical protein